MPYKGTKRKNPVTHCVRGHEFTLENTYLWRGFRHCIECSYIQKETKKIEALTHYGKNGTLACCWEGCTVNDVDMLSLDHVKNDGAEHRRKLVGNRSSFSGKGKDIYQWAICQGFPEGFQTLCMNHQFKKQRIKNRADRSNK